MGSASSSFEIKSIYWIRTTRSYLGGSNISAMGLIIPLAASGIDPDGSFKEVQILCEWGGLWRPHSSPIGLAQNLATCSYSSVAMDRFSGAGLATIFVTGWDNSGNYVVSDHRTISITSGSVAASDFILIQPLGKMKMNSFLATIMM